MQRLFSNKWFLLGILSLTWGSSFILIKKSLDVFTPYQIGALRVAVSGLLLMAVGFPALRKMPKKTLAWTITAGAFGNFIPMFLFPLAQIRVSSSLAAILDTLVPAFVLVLGFFLFGIRSRLIQIVGAVVGFIGAATLMYFLETDTVESHSGYAMLVVLATACYATSALIVTQKLQHVPSMQLSGGVFTFWMFPSIIILISSGFFHQFEGSTAQWKGLGYLSILAVFGTAIAMILYYQLIKATSAIFASTVTYILPVIAVIWGLLDGEHFTAWYVLGGLLIFLGIYFISKKKAANPEAE